MWSCGCFFTTFFLVHQCTVYRGTWAENTPVPRCLGAQTHHCTQNPVSHPENLLIHQKSENSYSIRKVGYDQKSSWEKFRKSQKISTKRIFRFSKTLGTGYWVLGTGYWVLGTGYWVLGTGYWVLGTGYWVLGTGYWVLGTGYWVLGTGYWVLGTGYWVLGTGYWVLGTGYWVLGTGYWVLGTGYWVLGTGYWAPRESTLKAAKAQVTGKTRYVIMFNFQLLVKIEQKNAAYFNLFVFSTRNKRVMFTLLNSYFFTHQSFCVTS